MQVCCKKYSFSHLEFEISSANVQRVIFSGGITVGSGILPNSRDELVA
jgi:hypothetical protein